MAERNNNGFGQRAREWTKEAVAYVKREMGELGEGRIAGKPWREALSRTFGKKRAGADGERARQTAARPTPERAPQTRRPSAKKAASRAKAPARKRKA